MQITFVAGAGNATLPLAAVHDARQVARLRARALACKHTHTLARTQIWR